MRFYRGSSWCFVPGNDLLYNVLGYLRRHLGSFIPPRISYKSSGFDLSNWKLVDYLTAAIQAMLGRIARRILSHLTLHSLAELSMLEERIPGERCLFLLSLSLIRNQLLCRGLYACIITSRKLFDNVEFQRFSYTKEQSVEYTKSLVKFCTMPSFQPCFLCSLHSSQA